MSRRGKIRARYRKVNLWLSERKYISPGNEIAVFNTPWGKMGLIICWDLIFPEIFRKMVQRGVRIVCCPSYWLKGKGGLVEPINPAAEEELVDALCSARAFENEIVLVYCNAAGEFSTPGFIDELIGHSQVVVPLQGVVKKLSHNNEEMIVTEIDLQNVVLAEKVYRLRQDLKQRPW